MELIGTYTIGGFQAASNPSAVRCGRLAMLNPDDFEVGRVYWMRETPPYLQVETWKSYVVVGVDVVPRWGNRARGALIRYRQCGGGARIYELYWYTFQRIARLKPPPWKAGGESNV